MKSACTEIKIRNIEKGTLQKLDDLASKNGLSRNEYLNRVLEKHVTEKAVNARDSFYSNIVKRNTEVLEEVVFLLREDRGL